jgi:two-component system, chemotaxis family, response regulator Rcp1
MENKFNCVLFIDDDKFNNIFNTRIADKHKSFNTIVSFTSGNEALNYLTKATLNNELKPDLIFLDINMPGMNGWEFIQEYKKIDASFIKDIKVFLLTTSSNPDDFEQSKLIDVVNDYFNKPLSLDLFEKIIMTYYKKNNTDTLN